MTVINFPTGGAPEKGASIVGPPRTGNAVIVDSRVIPQLHCYEHGENIEIILDGRFSVTVPALLAYEVAWMIANALAIGSGYPYMGAETKDRPFAPIYRGLDTPPTAV